MALFGNKKKSSEHLRTLSEKEIQNKLYGHLRPAGLLSNGPTAPAIKRPVSLESGISRNAAVLPNGPSLLEKKPNAQEKVSLWLEEENEIAENKFQPESFPRPKEKYARGRSGTLPQKILLPILSLLVSALRIGWKAILILWRTFARVILSFDFRKPGVRRTAYWLTAFALLAGIFFGIHFLNLKREAAMKTASRQSARAAATAKKPKVYQPPFPSPSLTLLPIPEPQSSKEAASPPSEKKGPLAPAAENANKNPGAEVKRTKEESLNAAELPKTASPAPSLPVVSEKEVVIQIATFATRADAEKLSGRLQQERFRSFVRSLSRSGGRVYYCVFIGGFQTYREAEAKLAEFRKREVGQSFKDAFLRSL